jgi:RNA polymerase sigma-70 factor (ECF subfamily)
VTGGSAPQPDPETSAAITAARASYGKLLSWLAFQWRDLAAAEDALSDAFLAALRTWPDRGIPRAPEAWLLTAARRNLLKVVRRHRMAHDPQTQFLLTVDEAMPDPVAIPDNRLRLMFICAHPAIDAPMRTALMLQTVLGIEAAQIGRVFLVSAEAMTKLLVRIKAKIRQAGIPFEDPDPQDLRPRLHGVLEAIYGAYTLRDTLTDHDTDRSDLGSEALYLASIVCALLPDEAEAMGLEALLLFCEARRPARHGPDGRFVALEDQDCTRWNVQLIAQGNALLVAAGALRRPGPFQIEAAIQAAHCHRVVTGITPWADIADLYAVLHRHMPTTGARLAEAVAVARARDDPAAGLRLLAELDSDALATHQPYWAVKAYLSQRTGDMQTTVEALWHARSLSADPALQQHFDERLAALKHLRQ